MYVDPVVEEFNMAIELYDKQFKSKGSRPRDKDWRPVRLAVRDVVIGLTVFKHEGKSNVILVRLCATYDPKAIPGWSGTKFITTLLLSQAFKTGSNMGVKFTYKVNEGAVPDLIQIMAADYGVELNHADEGIITPKEARLLYLAITEFSPDARAKIMQLAVNNLVAPERICYMVHHGTFTKEEMESVLLGTEFPENILGGKVTPREHMLFNDVVLRTRDVILGGVLNQKLQQKEEIDEKTGNILDLEGNDRYIGINFDPEYFAYVYDIQEETPVPWTKYAGWKLEEGSQMVVLVRARDIADFEYYFESDIAALEALKDKYGANAQYFLLSSRTINGLGESLMRYQEKLESLGIALMLCPESVPQLDQDIMLRMRDAETMRNEVGTQSDQEDMFTASAKPFNTTELKVVAMPADYAVGLLRMQKLLEQAMHDERELARGVNKFAVRDRYQRVMDRMQFLAHQALLSREAHYINVSLQTLIQMSQNWRINPDLARNYRIASTFWFGEKHGNMLASSKAMTQDSRVKSFIEQSLLDGYVVVVLQDKHSEGFYTSQEIDSNVLEDSFAEQEVHDELKVYHPKVDFDEVVAPKLEKVIELSRRGQPHSFNPSIIPNVVLTRVLHAFVYADGEPVSIDIVYTDGSQARPFPLFALNRMSNKQLSDLRSVDETEIGMLSMRHPELDTIVDHYWFRNIEMSQSGLTGAEVDEKAYQITMQRLKELESLNRKFRMRFYQTGLQPVVIGFYRAIVDFLSSRRGKDPILEVIPVFHDKRKEDKHDTGKPWV